MATTTTNYGLLKPAATDSYNHLVYDNPNMDTIDAAMKANSDAAITSATCVKTGTTHTIVRSNTDAPVFRFTATGDWNVGDTMVVDGVTVTPYLTNGESLSNGGYVINSDVLAIISGSRVTVLSNGINQLPADHVTYDNTLTGLSANDVQGAIDEIGQYPKTILSIPANTYTTMNQALNALRTAFQSLTPEEQKRAIITQGDRFFYQQREAIFSCTAVGASSAVFLTLFITPGTLYFGNMSANTSGNTFYDDTLIAQDMKIELIVR